VSLKNHKSTNNVKNLCIVSTQPSIFWLWQYAAITTVTATTDWSLKWKRRSLYVRFLSIYRN